MMLSAHVCSAGPQVGESVDPTKIPGLVAWYDARYLDLADGALVGSWPALVPFNVLTTDGPDLFQGTTSKMPVYAVNHNGNGPAVVFDGVDDYMIIWDNAEIWQWIDTGKWSAFAKFELISVGTRTILKPQLPSSPWDPGTITYDSTGAAIVSGRQASGGLSTARVNSAVSVGNPITVVGRWNVGTDVRCHVNGITEVVNTGYVDKTAVLGSGKEIYVGASYAGSGWANIALRSIGIFNRVISDAEVEYLDNV